MDGVMKGKREEFLKSVPGFGGLGKCLYSEKLKLKGEPGGLEGARGGMGGTKGG